MCASGDLDVADLPPGGILLEGVVDGHLATVDEGDLPVHVVLTSPSGYGDLRAESRDLRVAHVVQADPHLRQVAGWVADLRPLDEQVHVIFEHAHARIMAPPATESGPTLLPAAPEMLPNSALTKPMISN